MFGCSHINLLTLFLLGVEDESKYSVADLEVLDAGTDCNYSSGDTVTET
jgi:hypothetical protein